MAENPRRLAVMGLFVALMAVGAWLRVPLPTPLGLTYVTLQTAVAVLSAVLLSPGEAAVVMALYLALGLVGLPVFAHPGYAGLGYLVSPTFGYLLGFLGGAPLGAWVLGRGRARHRSSSLTFRRTLGAGLLVVVVVFACGVAYAWALARWALGAPVALASLLSATTAVLLVKDAMLATLIASIAPRVRGAIER